MPTAYKEIRQCPCGYRTIWTSAWSTHKKKCNEQVPNNVLIGEKDARISTLEEQLRETKDQLAEQLAAKDRQIEELIQVAKRPRNNNTTNTANTSTTTTTKNKFAVDASINAYGHETMDHISDEATQRLLMDPPSAVAKLVRRKHKDLAENRNIRMPNMKNGLYQVVAINAKGEKEWQFRSKGEFLEDVYEICVAFLEMHVDEDTPHGDGFYNFQDRVRFSQRGAVDGCKLWDDQIARVGCVLMGP